MNENLGDYPIVEGVQATEQRLYDLCFGCPDNLLLIFVWVPSYFPKP